MKDSSHLSILRRGVSTWNAWRKANPRVRPNLAGVDFTQIEPVHWRDSSGNRHATQLWRIDLKDADLRSAFLTAQELFEADLSGSNLEDAVLNDAIIKMSDMRGTNLRRANLKGVRLIGVNLRDADLTGATVFGISPWDVDLKNAVQNDLVLTPPSAPTITLDNIQVAQFVYTLLQNKNISGMIDTVTRRVVLILGRFTPKRKAILDGIRDGLRTRNYVPILFDFEKPVSRDVTETISTLAHMARFVIADLTDAKSIPQELDRIVPDLPSVPVQPLLLDSQHEYGMFEHFRRYPWVLEPVLYKNQKALMEALDKCVIAPSEKKARKQTGI